MTKHVATAHDQGEPMRQPRTSRQGKMALKKEENKTPDKKPGRPKAAKAPSMAIAEPLMTNSPSTNSNVEARIAERAYELFRHRGGHHGQDLEDWLTAERQVLSEESCCS